MVKRVLISAGALLVLALALGQASASGAIIGRVYTPLPAPLPMIVYVADVPTECGHQGAAACAWDLPGPQDMVIADASLTRDQFLHELGHVFDFTTMNDRSRSAFQAVTGDRRPWHAGYTRSPSEQFAEAYRTCAVYRRPPHYELGGLFAAAAYRPTADQWLRACNVIAAAALGVYGTR